MKLSVSRQGNSSTNGAFLSEKPNSNSANIGRIKENQSYEEVAEIALAMKGLGQNPQV